MLFSVFALLLTSCYTSVLSSAIDDDAPLSANIHRGTVSVCEHQTLTIRCADGENMRIISAVYGRFLPGNEACPHSSIRTTSCNSTSSAAKVREACEGKGECSVVASNGVFGDPCVGTFKYLEVQFRCQALPTCSYVGQFLPNPSNKLQYYHCTNGASGGLVPTLMNCASGTEWCQKWLTCTHRFASNGVQCPAK